MYFYDAHLHNTSMETGGFIIGLKADYCKGILSNEEALLLHLPEKKYIAFYYVSKEEIERTIAHKYLKYHARLEGYTSNEVIHSIQKNQPKAVIIDTLNEPCWNPYDYWTVVRKFPKIPFVLAHAGGYAINDFIKICNIQKNVWIDFSLTHSILGKYGKEQGLPYVHQAIQFGLKHDFKDRILLGSDYPFYLQDQILNYYGGNIRMLNYNFEALLDRIK